MKRILSLVLALALVTLLAACGSGSTDWARDQEYKLEARYDAGYEDGYHEGYYEGHEDGFDEGHEDGYDDGYHEGSTYGWKDRVGEVAEYFIDGATEFAIEYGGMHPEEAAAIIRDGGSKSEYETAAQTLYYYFLYTFDGWYN